MKERNKKRKHNEFEKKEEENNEFGGVWKTVSTTVEEQI